MGFPDYGYSPTDMERLRESERTDDDRSPFQRDLDRLIYTGAFRRLAGKTQVVTPGEADFFRTRLTHTLEVGQVARRLAEKLNREVVSSRNQRTLDKSHPGVGEWLAADGVVDPDVCEAAAVLHDRGHPPFGHAGEQALVEGLKDLCEGDDPVVPLADHGSFDGNAQSFRMAARSLTHRHPGGGLELTRAVLDAAIKYPRVHAPGVDKWSVFPTERRAFEEFVRGDVPEAARQFQTLEAQIMDWADDVAYSVHDLDDWFRAGFMPLTGLIGSPAQLNSFATRLVERWRAAGRITEKEENVVDGAARSLFARVDGPFAGFHQALKDGLALGDASSWDVGEAIRLARSALFGEFLGATEVGVRQGAESGWSQRYALELQIDPAVKMRCNILRELLWIYVVGSPQMATHQAGQRAVVRQLLMHHLTAARAGGTAWDIFPLDFREQLRNDPDDLELVRCVIDYVSGMTDAYALRRHARLVGRETPFNQFV